MCSMAEKHDSIPSNQETGFCVGSRFCDLRPLGFGGGGTVFSAVDSECEKSVAIKKISLTNQKRCQLALREVRIMRKLQHENIVKIYDILHPDETDTCEPKEESDESTTTNSTCLYLVQELLDTDLQHVIRSGILSKEHTRLFMYQLLRGLKYLHSSNVLHRDLKPSNLLINLEDLVLKIGDFGMARILDPDYCHKGNLTQNVSTRQYRSPELMLHPSNYAKAIDIWAAGCVFAEMLLGKPLFPADHDLEHMMLILEFIPLQDDDLNDILASLPSKMLKNYKGTPRRPLCQLFPDAEPFAIDLLQAMLTFDPNQRITAEEAILHPYLKIYSCTLDEPLHQDPFHIENEVDNLSPPTLRRIIFNESQAQSPSKVIDLAQCDENISIEEMDESDDYRLKLELLGISLRDNSDLDSDGEEKLDFANFEKDFEKDQDNATTEKNESESSEKTDEELKEHKLLQWELQELDSRRSSKDIDELELECQEKGVIESSDEEGSEKLESRDEKSDDEKSDKFKKQVGIDSGEGSSTGRSPSPKEKMDKNEALRRKCRDGKENKEEEMSSNKEGSSDFSEKATDDKFEKEKSEKTCQREEEDSEKSETEESIVIELQDKNMYSDDDGTTSSEITNELAYEKTLEDCLAARSSKQRHFSGTRILDENNLSEDLNNANSLSLPPSLLNTTQMISRKTQVPNSNIVSGSSVQISDDNSQSPTANDSLLQGGTSRNISEMLYVDIPRPSSVPVAPSSMTSKSSPLQAMAPHHSPRPRASLSPREKSVRPKKQDWFYKYNKSGHS